MDKQITNIKAEQILDSRKNPTLKITVFVNDISDSFEVPSGASTGIYEAYELRDGANGKSSVTKAIEKIESVIRSALLGMNIDNQELIDDKMIELDGTKQKTNLGGNSMIGVSIACAKTAAKILKIPTYKYLKMLKDIKPSRINPFLYFNLINGGKHASSLLAFQEFHIVPQVDNLEKSVKISGEIQARLDKILKEKYGQIPEKGDEGGVALSVTNIFEPLDLLVQATKECNYSDQIMFALDVASSSFYLHDKSLYKFMDKEWTKEEMIELYKKICSEYKIISIEDPFDEEDFESFAKLQNELPNVKLIGDDLTVTNVERLNKAINLKSIKGIIIKPNQIGTLSETINTMKMARDNNIDCIISHRSGETMDDFIADLAYGFGCFGIKAGALGPKERNIKYDRLIKISNKQ